MIHWEILIFPDYHTTHHYVFVREILKSKLTNNWFALIIYNIKLASSLCVCLK